MEMDPNTTDCPLPLKVQIAASLEKAFSQYGFAEPSVAQLKTACNVSLRTLYKHYPSKEAMIVAALEYRHQRYLSFLADDSLTNGTESVLHIFTQLEKWMQQFAPNGCMSMNAITAFPDNQDVINVVAGHKEEVRQRLAQVSCRPDLASALFLLHEGASATWPLQGQESILSAKQIISIIMESPVCRP
ncbi:TetR/AcrR family transcriptional regulator [Shewanella sp. KT0246]|uniref:TetR/AcrR family transcriptional regulator n=2 Tax=Shewanella TaxID=22 RepID=UPI001BB8471F|nr:TetR/AcrR family transcriptional regulator [Shewanella sp. KT0246]GIU53505.1 TetR family transcriptional regulator [Shewanella sp. KT0246]